MPAACEQERILSVTELTDRMRRTLEGTFPFVWVRGEIGELSFPGSGHIYFTLKDAGAQLQCVWFRDRQMRGRNFDPLTGEIFAEPRPDPCACCGRAPNSSVPDRSVSTGRAAGTS